MSLAWLPCLLVCLTPAQGNDLAITNPRTTYGHLGAPRPKEGALPGDTVHFTFEIKNLKLDASNKAAYSIGIEIRDAAGKLFYEQKPYNAVAQNFLGGDSLPCSAHIEIPLDAKPGPVKWKVAVTDRTTKKTVSVEGVGKIVPADFGIVQVGLFADPETRIPMPAVGVVGHAAYFKFAAVGFGRNGTTKQPNVQMTMRILDEKGKATTEKPIIGVIDKGIDPEDRWLNMQLGLTFNRVGRFTIELTATDRVSRKSSTIRYGFRVLDLE